MANCNYEGNQPRKQKQRISWEMENYKKNHWKVLHEMVSPIMSSEFKFPFRNYFSIFKSNRMDIENCICLQIKGFINWIAESIGWEREINSWQQMILSFQFTYWACLELVNTFSGWMTHSLLYTSISILSITWPTDSKYFCHFSHWSRTTK